MYTLNIDNSDKLFFTSDIHFGHYNISKYCLRPFESRSDMDKQLIDNWNSVVPEDGIVVCCGDFMLPHKTCFKEYWKYIKQLNGTIYLTRGNHDRIDIGEYNETNQNVPHNLVQSNILPKLIVQDMIKIYVNDISIFACHYPLFSFPADFQVFGHIHTLSDGTCHGIDKNIIKHLSDFQYDVGVDHNNYKPISYRSLMNKLTIK